MDKFRDDFMVRANISWTGRCLSISCTKFDESGIESQSKYRIRACIRESNNGNSKFGSDFVCLAGVVNECAVL